MRLRFLLAASAALLVSCGTEPIPPEISTVVSGNGFSCALVGEAAWCWGRNDFGQLGRGTTGGDSTPGPVEGDFRFRLLAAGERTTCGVTTDDMVRCWGHGRIFGLTAPSPNTVAITGVVPPGITYLGVGYSHGCVLMATGAAACFGTNNVGEIGQGSTQSTGALPATVVSGGHIFSQISVGAFATCGVESGKLWCWGGNFATSLSATNNFGAVPTPTEVTLPFAIQRVDLGSAITCALDSESQAWCWGSNVAAQLGRGIGTASLSSAEPMLVSGTSKFQALALSNLNSTITHTCGIDLTGATLCWGLGEASQLGRVASETCVVSSTTSYPCSGVPAGIEAILSIKKLAPGRDHTCALTEQGEVYCWGSDARRQLGGSIGGSTRLGIRVDLPR